MFELAPFWKRDNELSSWFGDFSFSAKGLFSYIYSAKCEFSRQEASDSESSGDISETAGNSITDASSTSTIPLITPMSPPRTPSVKPRSPSVYFFEKRRRNMYRTSITAITVSTKHTAQ